jgi:hypothetical protein
MRQWRVGATGLVNLAASLWIAGLEDAERTHIVAMFRDVLSKQPARSFGGSPNA